MIIQNCGTKLQSYKDADAYHGLGFLFLHFLFLAVVVRHGNNGQDEIDQIERTHEDDDDEENDVN